MSHRLKRWVIDPAKAGESKSEAKACHGQIPVNARGSCKEKVAERESIFHNGREVHGTFVLEQLAKICIVPSLSIY